MLDKQPQNFDNQNNENELNLSDELMEPTPDINKNIIPHIKNDYLLSHINKNIERSNHNDTGDDLQESNSKNKKNDFQTFLDENIDSNEALNDNSVIFTNSFIQISLIRANLLRKIFGRNSEKLLKIHFKRWKKSNPQIEFGRNLFKNDFISRTLQEDLNKISHDIMNANYNQNDPRNNNKKENNESDYLNQNRKVIQNYLLDDNDHSNFDNYERDEANYDQANTREKTDSYYFNNNSSGSPDPNTKINQKANNLDDWDDNENLNHTKRNIYPNLQVEKDFINNNNYNTHRNLSRDSFKHVGENWNNNYNNNLGGMSMKNIDLSPSLNMDPSNLQNYNEGKKFSRTTSLNISKEVKNNFMKSDHQSDFARKLNVFCNKIGYILFTKQKNYALILLLSLFKKAFKEEGESHCINTFRLFTKYSISQNKLKKLQNQISVKQDQASNDELISKINQLKSERESIIKTNENMINHFKNECSKLEQNLKEKAMIIFNKNDEIEANREQIEILNQKNDGYKEQIDLLNKKIEKLESKINNTKLNIIEESLCKNCKNSLEESFMHENHHSSKNRTENDLAMSIDKSQELDKLRQREQELKKTIHEQLAYIIKMEEEMREVKLKNSDFKSKNELILNELEIIKVEFNNLSENLNKNLRNKSDAYVQTIDSFNSFENQNNNVSYNKLNIDKNFNYTNGNNSMNNKNENLDKEKDKKKSVSKTISGKSLIKKNKQYSNKLVLPESKNKKDSISNYNTNTATNTNINININNNFKTELDLLISEREQFQNLKFDNSVLTKEIVGLNKEVNKLKAENKSLADNYKKTDKERTELATKLKSKSESFEKIKKENEELMIMIQSSNYKTFVSIETENKRIKSENNQLMKEIENYKNEIISFEKALKDKENELDKLKKNFENFNKFKNDRENLILENTKLESELKRTRFDMEEIKSVIEKQSILLRNKDECLNKLSEEFNYLSFNAKKLKQESDKNLQDAIAYQQIVRKMEKELAECQIKKEKYENELRIIKANLMK